MRARQRARTRPGKGWACRDGDGPKANRRRSYSLLGSYPAARSVWTASHPMAVQRLAQMRRRPGSRTHGPPVAHFVHSATALRGGQGYWTRRRPRRYPRFNVAWPVVVEAGKRFFLLQAVNVGGRGAKVRPTERLGEGRIARLHFHPPNGPSLDVEAVGWRVDRDGLAFFFTHDNHRRLTSVLAQLAGAPLALWTSTLS
jgi:hypothetical protein